MIGSLGGATVDSDGNRNYPGSGGAIGGISFPGGNWAYFSGAGSEYNRFTPNNSNFGGLMKSSTNIMMRPEQPGLCSADLGNCPVGGDDPIIYGPGPTNVNISPINDPCSGNSAPSCSTTDIPIETPNPFSMDDLIASLLAPGSRTNVASVPPIYSFNPFSNQGTGIDMKKIGIILVGILIAFWLYKKYGNKLIPA